VKTAKGETLVFEGNLTIGAEIFVQGSGESKEVAKDGKYTLEDKTVLKVEKGKVVEILETKVAEFTYTIKQVGNIPEIKTVAVASAEASATWVRIKGVVMGQTQAGVVVADETGAIFCDDITTASVGETVEVSGNILASNKYFMLDNCHYERIPVDSKAEYPTPTAVTSELIASIADREAASTLEYVKLTGTAAADPIGSTGGDVKGIRFQVGDYWLVSHNVHSSVYVKNALDKEVEVCGYACRFDGSDLKIVITDLKWPEKAEAAE